MSRHNQMKKLFFFVRKFWFLIPIGIILGVFFFVYRPFEPHYGGKPLSAWTMQVFSADTHDRAVEAIRHIGTNALPYAIKFCSKRGSELRRKITLWLYYHNSKQPELGDFSSELIWYGIRIPLPQDTRDKGIAIFVALGAMAKPAIPDLIKLMQDGDPGVGNAAADCLMNIGPDAIPPLIDVLTNQNQQGWFMAMFSLEHMRDTKGNLQSELRAATPILIQRLKDENIRVRQASARALEKIQLDAPIIVPALIEALEDATNSSEHIELSWAYMRALDSFSTNARLAVPVLVGIINNDSSGKATEALKTLGRIAPEIAQPYIDKFNAALTNPPPDASISNLFYNYYGQGNPPNQNDHLPSALSASTN